MIDPAIFPISKSYTYLMNAAQAPLNSKGQAAISAYLDLAATDLNARPSVREPIRDLLARLLGGHSSDYALTTSTGAGISMIAAGHNWKAGDNVVLPAGEHWNNTFPWFRLQDQGVEVRLVEPDQDNRVTAQAFANHVDKNTRVIGTTAVRFDTGFRSDLTSLSDLARSCDALFVVDGIQCAGANDLNVERHGIDVLACGGFKWLLGMAGTGFLYVNQRARNRVKPVAPGMFSAEHSFTELNHHKDARRYETGSLAYVLFHGWAEGLRILEDVGISAIAARNRLLTDRVLAGLKDKGFEICSPHESAEERSAIVAFSAGDKAKNKAIAERLEAERVLISFRGDTLRVSPNFYNTEAEIDRFLNLL